MVLSASSSVSFSSCFIAVSQLMVAFTSVSLLVVGVSGFSLIFFATSCSSSVSVSSRLSIFRSLWNCLGNACFLDLWLFRADAGFLVVLLSLVGLV